MANFGIGGIDYGDNNQNNNEVQGSNEESSGENQNNNTNNENQNNQTNANNESQNDSQQNGLNDNNENQETDNGGGINYVDYYNGEYYIKDGVKYWTTKRGDEIKAVIEPDGTQTLIEMKLGDETKNYIRAKTMLKKIIEKMLADCEINTMEWAFLSRINLFVVNDNPLMFAFESSDVKLSESD